MNALSEYKYFCIKNITSYTFLFVFKIVESVQPMLSAISAMFCRRG